MRSSALGADSGRIQAAVHSRVPAPVQGQPLELRWAGTPEVAAPVSARPDALLKRILLMTGAVAQTDKRERFGVEDLIRASVGDEDGSRLLAGLGIDLEVLRHRLQRDPPAA